MKSLMFIKDIAPALAYFVAYPLLHWIPNTIRPPIDVETLVRWERTLFGSLPHEWIGAHFTAFKDVAAAFPYNLHFFVPLIFTIVLCKRWRAGLSSFAWCFAMMNFGWIVSSFFFPAAPPWYFDNFGLTPGDYSMIGDPAGLARVDTLMGIPYFHGIYTQSSVVFGAFPSMHAAWPVLVALFSPRVAPRWTGFFWLYTLWVWWAAVYLHHHYVVDLLGGALFALVPYLFFKRYVFGSQQGRQVADEAKLVK